MAKEKRRYVEAHGCKLSEDADVEFNRVDDGSLHVRVNTFGKNHVTLSEETFIGLMDAYNEFKALATTDERKT